MARLERGPQTSIADMVIRYASQTDRAAPVSKRTATDKRDAVGSTVSDLEARLSTVERELVDLRKLAVQILMKGVTGEVTINGNAVTRGNALSPAEKMRRYRQRRKRAQQGG